MSDHSTDPRSGAGAFDADLALSRLEDVLLDLPFDRALPDPAELLARAGVPIELLRRDERAHKVLHEAIVARPFGRLDEARRTRAEVELLTLEVEVLSDRLGEAAGDTVATEAIVVRLREIRARLDEIDEAL